MGAWARGSMGVMGSARARWSYQPSAVSYQPIRLGAHRRTGARGRGSMGTPRARALTRAPARASRFQSASENLYAPRRHHGTTLLAFSCRLLARSREPSVIIRVYPCPSVVKLFLLASFSHHEEHEAHEGLSWQAAASAFGVRRHDAAFRSTAVPAVIHLDARAGCPCDRFDSPGCRAARTQYGGKGLGSETNGENGDHGPILGGVAEFLSRGR
jgi:hypothetical protein